MRHFLVILSLCFWIETWAQTPAVLKGVVVESTIKGKIEPIIGAVIHWQGSNHAVSTNASGVFEIKVEPNSNHLIVQALGFENDTILVKDINYLKVLMVSKRNLKDVVISYEKKTTEVSFIDPWKTTIMNEKELFKAACCNLSESFETNPSVDVAYSDALTGSKQIQMLGLAGQYTQMSQEQMPGIRGIATNFGLNYTPGTWVNSIQVSKGLGSVVNGFESVSGQINVELHKPTSKDKLYWNGYASQGGRFETNLVLAQQPSKMFSHALFLHGSNTVLRMDQNKDEYLDNPLGTQANILYRMFIDNKTGLVFHASVQYVNDKKTGGQFAFKESMQDTSNNTVYGTQIASERLNGFMKLGYVFPKNKYKSIGLQVSGTQQKFDNFFGNNLYNANQQSAYANLIYQDIIGNPNHRLRAGFSQQSDWVDEKLFNKQAYHFIRNEQVSGAFAEYTYSYKALFTMVAGTRMDYHNWFGWKFVPRLHLRYAPISSTVFRAVAGKGWRTANLISENMGSLASSRIWNFSNANTPKTAYGFVPEEAWNFGLNLNHEFKLNYRPGSFGVDYYYTLFTKQVVVDRDFNPQQVLFYALNGNSTSRSLQVQLDYQPIRRFDVRFAYRWFDVKTQYQDALRAVPLIAQNRWFVNLSYTIKSKWNFDFTTNWVGQKRLPITQSNPIYLQRKDFSSDYWLMNAQVSKTFKNRLDIYLGMENLLNFQQPNAILDGQNPFGNYFDASMIWGPIFGRMVYAGFRFKM
ncbi:MAG: TonB-dependent receptor [Bacteroidia bacterium]|nr:TonB-dependent receptor [Bacteroidia bacterium]MCF8425878.1 TonB-dependent receptor [Bacteroidia bacterium]MCF8445657.1 TonB-dependent receptor [Bacteroidia bacterium]